MLDRPTSPGIDALLGERFNVLNHGFIRVIDYMGGDSAVVQAARVSYGSGTRNVRDDRALIRYLLRAGHTTPFEMCEIKLHVKLPIFVARQWIRHRTASVNEYSARYSVLDKEFYLPDTSAIAEQSSSNRQGRGRGVPEDQAEWVRGLMVEDAERSYANYMAMLNQDESGEALVGGRMGVARELARANLPVSFYTQWYWKIDLHNLMHFLRLRADPHAQWEMRQYAEVLIRLMKAWVPQTYEAFVDYRLGGFELSKEAARVVSEWVAGHRPGREDTALTEREWEELTAKFLPT